MYRLRAKRTTGLNPPAELLFGELAYSDANKRLYVGRPDGSPATFESDLSLAPITDSIAVLNVASAVQDNAIASLTTDLATLDTSQTAQETAIALLSAAIDSQGDAIGQLFTSTSTLNGALVSLTADVQAALETKANDADLATVSKTGAYSDLTGLPTLFSGAYGDLSGKPNLFSGAYADLSGKPTLFSGAYDDLSGKPTLFSGAYGDLSGKPTIPAGFTFDQQSEPSNPAAGATWRERSSAGLIVGEWEWSGSLWLSALLRDNDRGSNFAALTGAAATGINFIPFSFPREKILFLYSVISGRQTTGTLNSTNFYTATIFQRDDDGPLTAFPTNVSGVINAAAGANAVINLSLPINQTLNLGWPRRSSLAISYAVTGTPGACRVSHTAFYKYIR